MRWLIVSAAAVEAGAIPRNLDNAIKSNPCAGT